MLTGPLAWPIAFSHAEADAYSADTAPEAAIRSCGGRISHVGVSAGDEAIKSDA